MQLPAGIFRCGCLGDGSQHIILSFQCYNASVYGSLNFRVQRTSGVDNVQAVFFILVLNDIRVCCHGGGRVASTASRVGAGVTSDFDVIEDQDKKTAWTPSSIGTCLILWRFLSLLENIQTGILNSLLIFKVSLKNK